MDAIQKLPRVSAFSSSSVRSYLDEKLNTSQALAHGSSLGSELQTHCSELDRTLLDLNRRLELSLAAYASFSDRIGHLLADVNVRLADLSSCTCVRSSIADGRKEEGVERTELILGQELPALAKEVARVETVRVYAETALKLDSLVGDIEDAVSSSTSKKLGKHYSQIHSGDIRLHAIKTLKKTEDVLSSVAKTRPQWAQLVAAVDHRVDRALAILRPQAVADHRAFLASLGWPPPLSALTSNSDTRDSTQAKNPLLTMQGDLKHQYFENFIALCSLQELQRQRKSRQLEGHNREIALHQPLWAIEELVNPVTIAFQRHFSKWNNKPEFIFALVQKITRDYVDSMDELLQPLVDEAELVGYSCREEWVSAMANSLAIYLAKEMFPVYVSQLDEEAVTGIKSQARISWLHLVDLMISFDNQIKSLVSQSGILSLQDDTNLLKVSSLSVFNDRPDWLDLWAEIELGDTLEKLKPEIDDERSWTMRVKGDLLSSSENYKSPIISSAVLRCLSSVINRCRSLPTIPLRSRFIRIAGAPIIRKFLDCLALRCQEAEGLTALTDDDALIKVANSINADRYFDSVLKEWCEDIFFLEMGIDDVDQPVEATSGIFTEEIQNLKNFRVEWVNKLSVVVLRGFDAQSREYIKNRRQWQEKSEDESTVSKTLVNSLDYLQGKMSVVEINLNEKDFVSVWRSLAGGIDRLLFSGVLMSNVKFHDGGVAKFGADLEVLCAVFRAWCLRPEGFFPRLSDGLKMLKMSEIQLNSCLSGGQIRMKENGIRHLSVSEAEKIVKSRVFNN